MANKENLPSSPPIELLDKFLDNQGKELQLRSQQLALKQQEDQNSFAFSNQALQVQAQDRKEQREFYLQQQKYTLIMLAFISSLFFGLIGYALHSGKMDFAIELVKAIIYLVSGGLGGYGYARIKQSKDTISPSEND
jgi:hypothetical protein